MQFAQTKPPRGVIYDSSFGESIDTVLALAMLHAFEGKNQARIAAISTSKANLKSAQLCDVIEKFYASATTGIAAQFFQGLAIGLATGNDLKEDTPILTGTLGRKDEKGSPVYTPRIRDIKDTAAPEVLIRNALLAQYDGNAAMIVAGPATTLTRLLALRGAKEIVAAKVSVLVTTCEISGALASQWPTLIVECPEETGKQLLYPGESIEKDFAYSPAHPVADAYRACHAMPYDAPTSAMAAALYAVKPDDGYFRVSGSSNRRRLLADPAQKDRVIKTYIEMASAKPVPRSFRRLQQQQNVENENKDEQKNQ